MDEKTTNPNGGSNEARVVKDNNVEENIKNAGFNMNLRFIGYSAEGRKTVFHNQMSFVDTIKNLVNGVITKLKDNKPKEVSNKPNKSKQQSDLSK